jgi:biotin carboxyl carrier protein
MSEKSTMQVTSGNRTFIVREESGKIFIDDEAFDLRVSRLADGRLQVFSGDRVFVAELIPGSSGSSYTVVIKGHTVQVELKSPLDLRLEQMGMNETTARAKHIVSPMPGLITDVKVSAGDEVSPGAPLLVLEAMKMENVLQAPAQAVISAIKVKKGDRVEKGQVLVEF